MRVFSDLNLNEQAPARVQPIIGEWGPEQVPTTRFKRWMRVWVSLAFVVGVGALFAMGYWVFTLMNGQ